MTLTREEILSNLVVYAFAGNDTTAIALTNLFTHLAANPDTQDWISEEINYYLPSNDLGSWGYGTFFKLKRCCAAVMETLRICHPLSQLVKTTSLSAQPLEINGKTYMIPAGVSVNCSLPALHTHPRYWADNPLIWKPARFISTTDSGHDNKEPDERGKFDAKILAPETSEKFMPFAWGQRVCPGKKFAQVELVAVLARLFRDWRVEPEPRPGENLEQARDRVWRSSLVVDHERHMLHEMVNPENVGLRLDSLDAKHLAEYGEVMRRMSEMEGLFVISITGPQAPVSVFNAHADKLRSDMLKSRYKTKYKELKKVLKEVKEENVDEKIKNAFEVVKKTESKIKSLDSFIEKYTSDIRKNEKKHEQLNGGRRANDEKSKAVDEW
ncbi:hypothetical protein BOTCAL_0035g00110 [Botryotinia calthae]|uniref:Cytochrome P450 n=1 Tax=Botryotinia calthae TaxID=38488 RepID=A0A4Y8DF06_9HELO|nr:hypothetical protein BOTCAL_0035g00110 [Botryotinia calthae]